MPGEVWVAVTVLDGAVTDLEVLDAEPQWAPLPGQRFFAANVNGGDSLDVTPPYRVHPTRQEHEPCQRGTVGCCVDHHGDEPCETW